MGRVGSKTIIYILTMQHGDKVPALRTYLVLHIVIRIAKITSTWGANTAKHSSLGFNRNGANVSDSQIPDNRVGEHFLLSIGSTM